MELSRSTIAGNNLLLSFFSFFEGMATSRRIFLCMDCKVDTGKIGEFYMLRNETWNLIHNSNRGMLCVGCLEKRLGRQLEKSDFNDSFVNRTAPGRFFSVRLANRLQLGTSKL